MKSSNIAGQGGDWQVDTCPWSFLDQLRIERLVKSRGDSGVCPQVADF